MTSAINPPAQWGGNPPAQKSELGISPETSSSAQIDLLQKVIAAEEQAWTELCASYINSSYANPFMALIITGRQLACQEIDKDVQKAAEMFLKILNHLGKDHTFIQIMDFPGINVIKAIFQSAKTPADLHTLMNEHMQQVICICMNEDEKKTTSEQFSKMIRSLHVNREELARLTSA